MVPRAIARLVESSWFGLLARTALTLPFWASAFSKLLDWNGALAEAAHFGLTPRWLVAGSIIGTQLGGSALVIAGRWTWLGAGALGVFTIIATIIAHPFWSVADPLIRFHERNTFLEHVGLVGGLMVAAILAGRECRE